MSCGRGCCASFAEHVRSLTISPSVYNPNVGKQNRYDKTLAADRDAFKRLHDQGITPGTLRGSATLEARADSRFEISTGRVQTDPKIAKRLDSAVAEAAQITGAAA